LLCPQFSLGNLVAMILLEFLHLLIVL